MRKILRNMYLKSIPRRQRRKSRTIAGKIMPGTWREWLTDGGPKAYLEAIEKSNRKLKEA